MRSRRQWLFAGLSLAACGPGRVDAPAQAQRAESADFVRVKRWILDRGDRQTFSQMYNHNPHYAFGDVDAFLIPDVGQRNIDCDPRRSDFDAVVLRFTSTDGQRYATVTHRNGTVVFENEEAAAEQHWRRLVATVSAGERKDR